MSKLAHSHQSTMNAIDIRRAIESRDVDLLPPPLSTLVTVVQAISLSRGVLPNHPYYLTKYQMITICENALKSITGEQS